MMGRVKNEHFSASFQEFRECALSISASLDFGRPLPAPLRSSAQKRMNEAVNF